MNKKKKASRKVSANRRGYKHNPNSGPTKIKLPLGLMDRIMGMISGRSSGRGK